MELGCGATGLPGIIAHRYCAAHHVIFTDMIGNREVIYDTICVTSNSIII